MSLRTPELGTRALHAGPDDVGHPQRVRGCPTLTEGRAIARCLATALRHCHHVGLVDFYGFFEGQRDGLFLRGFCYTDRCELRFDDAA